MNIHDSINRTKKRSKLPIVRSVGSDHFDRLLVVVDAVHLDAHLKPLLETLF